MRIPTHKHNPLSLSLSLMNIHSHTRCKQQILISGVHSYCGFASYFRFKSKHTTYSDANYLCKLGHTKSNFSFGPLQSWDGTGSILGLRGFFEMSMWAGDHIETSSNRPSEERTTRDKSHHPLSSSSPIISLQQRVSIFL